MTAGRWHSLPDREMPTFGHFDTTSIDDDEVRSALERIKQELEQLNRGCATPLYGMRAHCWMPDVTTVRYGYYMASFNEMVLSVPLTDNEVTTRKVMLPDAATRPGGYVEIVDYSGDSGTTNITVATIKGQAINGAATFAINENYAAIQFRSDGAEWRVVGRGSGSTATTDHGSLAGLGDDDHTQYMLGSGAVTGGTVPVYNGTGGRTLEDTPVVIDPANGSMTGIGSIGRNGPIDDKGQCRVYRNTSAQAVVATTWTKIQFNAETFDSDSLFDSSTNFRYTPTQAGKYTVRARLVADIDAAEWTADPTGQAHGIAVYKNGSAVGYGNVGADHNGKIAMMVFDEADMNGSTDYLEIFAYSVPGCNITNGSAASYASFERVD